MGIGVLLEERLGLTQARSGQRGRYQNGSRQVMEGKKHVVSLKEGARLANFKECMIAITLVLGLGCRRRGRSMPGISTPGGRQARYNEPGGGFAGSFLAKRLPD
jgi:hypothetical protein